MANKQDYASSRAALAQGSVEKARYHLPDKERGTFITLMEQTYLGLLQGRPNIDQLATYAEPLDKRLRVELSREARTFFYLRTPEDYYASEHEVIWLHMLLSWGYSMRGDYEAGCVEARKSENLLSLPWSEEGNFDDPALRIFLGALFAYCGEWGEAQVDFRRAALLAPELEWLHELASLERQPAELILILGGIGPEPQWEPELAGNPLRGFRQVSFSYPGHRSPLRITDAKGEYLDSFITTGAEPWYERHLIRDNAIQELVQDSRYGGSVAANGLLATAKIGIATAAGITVATVGLAAGIGIAYIGLEGNSSDMIELGVTVAGVGITTGYNMAKKAYYRAKRDLERELNPASQYRFVRFLPEYFWLGWSRTPLQYPLRLSIRHERERTIKKPKQSPPRVSFGYMPDVGMTP